MLQPLSFAQNVVSYDGVDPARDATVSLPLGDGKASWIDARDVDEELKLVVEFIDIDGGNPVGRDAAALGRIPAGKQAIDVVLQLPDTMKRIVMDQ